jgi:hypothetical protein
MVSPFSSIDSMTVRASYERISTNTRNLANSLSSQQDLNRLTSDFDNGLTGLRDVGNMITSQRDAILASYNNHTIGAVYSEYPELFAIPVANLHDKVTNGGNGQSVGHNFFVNATGFIDAELPWALDFDKNLK